MITVRSRSNSITSPVTPPRPLSPKETDSFFTPQALQQEADLNQMKQAIRKKMNAFLLNKFTPLWERAKSEDLKSEGLKLLALTKELQSDQIQINHDRLKKIESDFNAAQKRILELTTKKESNLTKKITDMTFDDLFTTGKKDLDFYTWFLSEPQPVDPHVTLNSNSDRIICPTVVANVLPDSTKPIMTDFDQQKVLIQTKANESIGFQSKSTKLDFSQKLILHPNSNAAQVKNLLNILDDIQKKVNLNQVTSDITCFQNSGIVDDLLKILKSTNALIFLKNSSDEQTKDFLLYLLIAATNQNKIWTYFSHVGIIAKTDEIKKIIQKIKSQFTFKKRCKIDGVRCLYEGHLDKDGNPSGQGRLTYSNGRLYEGEFENGMIQGQGKMIYPNGESYEGSFKNGKRHGLGDLIFNDDCVYKVESKFDEKYSKVKGIIYPDGRIYEGECKYTEEHGQGKMTYPNDNVYEGSFKDGRAHGQGKIIYSNGDIHHGIWENGTLLLGKTA